MFLAEITCSGLRLQPVTACPTHLAVAVLVMGYCSN